MSVVLEHERRLGNDPLDVSRENHGWDILSCTPDHEVRFLEVKGRVAGATTVTVTRNEMLAALNQPRRWFLWSFLWTGNRPMARTTSRPPSTANRAGRNPASIWT